MLKTWELKPEPFTTIDDLIGKARELFFGLSQLGEYKHPLAVRKGIAIKGEAVSVVQDQVESRTLKAKGKTYFFDIKRTEQGKAYLVITESRLQGEGKSQRRSAIIVFPDSGHGFAAAVSEMVEKLR